MAQLIQSLFEEQKEYINHFFNHVDADQMEEFFQICLACTGMIIFTGVGKSGIVAEKIAATLISTGTRALYLPPTNFLHGDLGIVTSEDLVILLSKSGDTEELLEIVPFFRQKKAKILSVVSHDQSRLEKITDFTIHLPVKKELCPFDLAPTTSTAVQLLFGDLLATALMRAKGIGVEEYASNHPSGAIGRKLKMTLRVEEIMLKGKQIPLCFPKTKLVDALMELSNKKCGCLLIANEARDLLGIFTDGDLRRSLQVDGPKVLEKTMETLMVKSPITIEKNLFAWDAARIMQKDPKKWVMVAPVLEKNKVVGIIRMHDIIQAGG
ncbi:MAG: KpsF/GutQ family sugar-phosphate isomerase [Chlamydiae bacterium]|nr:KpsF/GutQ family sugar-phosphate isomerase [Chlamydiota bacterium]